jgi:hypothetical protein
MLMINMTSEEKYKREEKAFDWFTKRKQITEYNRQEGKWESFDFWLTSGTTRYLVEVKIREDYTSTEIERFGGSFFEFTKCEGVRRYKKNNGVNHELLYFCFYQDCLTIYNTSTDPSTYNWEMRLLPDDNNEKELVWKWVTCLNEKDIIEKIKYK